MNLQQFTTVYGPVCVNLHIKNTGLRNSVLWPPWTLTQIILICSILGPRRSALHAYKLGKWSAIVFGLLRPSQAARSAACRRREAPFAIVFGFLCPSKAARSAARAILVVMRLSCKKIHIKWGPSRPQKTLICFCAYEFIAPPHPPSSMLWCKVRGCGRSRKNAHFCLRLVSSTPSTLKLGVRGEASTQRKIKR